MIEPDLRSQGPLPDTLLLAAGISRADAEAINVISVATQPLALKGLTWAGFPADWVMNALPLATRVVVGSNLFTSLYISLSIF